MKIRPIHEKLCRINRKLYALQNQQKILQKALDGMPRSLFNRKDRKVLQERIEGIGRQIETCRTQLEFIPTQYGFGSVSAAEAEYRSAKKQLDQIRNEQDNRDGKIPSGNNERPSVLEELRKNRRDTDRVRPSGKGCGRCFVKISCTSVLFFIFPLRDSAQNVLVFERVVVRILLKIQITAVG